MKRNLSVAAICAAMSIVPMSVSAVSTNYIPLGVPAINSSFKTYMDYRMVVNECSAQYKFIRAWGWSDYDGFMRCNGETDLGITDNYYMVALGSYYGTEIGTKYKVTTDTGHQFYCVLSECKDDADTNETHQYAGDNDIIEFLVDIDRLIGSVKEAGSANVYMPLNGSVMSIERIDFEN